MGQLGNVFKIIKKVITEAKILPNLNIKFIRGMCIIMDFFIFIISFLISIIYLS